MNPITSFKQHPMITGAISSSASVSFSVIGVLSEQSTVRLLGSIGAIMGILLTLVTIIITIKKSIRK